MSAPTPAAPLMLSGVYKRYGPTPVLQGTDLTLRAGELVALTGASGAGKSVLLKLAATLIRPDAGEVRVCGEAPPYRDRAGMARLHALVGMQFQNLGLFAFLSVHDNLAFSLRRLGMNEDDVRARVTPVLEDLGLTDAAARFPDEISGGMKRRLAIGRVLVKQPRVAFFDDPAAGLDPLTSERVLARIDDWRRATDAAVIVAGPDPEPLTAMSDRVVALRGGRLEEAT